MSDNRRQKNYVEFIEGLVGNKYLLTENDLVATNLVFSSEWVNPRLDQTLNYYFKVNYLANILSNELIKFGYKLNISEIKDRAYRKNIVVYHKRSMDKETNREADYFFLIDLKSFRAYVYKWFPDLAVKKDELFSTRKKILTGSEIPVDDYFYNAQSFADDKYSDIEIKSAREIISELTAENAKLLVYLDNQEILPISIEKTEIEVPIQKVNQFHIHVISPQNPLIDNVVTFAIEKPGGQRLYAASGAIIRERTVSYKKFYELEILITFDTCEKILHSKAVFVFIEKLKNESV